jgi:hypothetical protein
VSRISVVGIATVYGLDVREFGVRVPIGSRIFFSSYRPDGFWGAPNLPPTALPYQRLMKSVDILRRWNEHSRLVLRFTKSSQECFKSFLQYLWINRHGNSLHSCFTHLQDVMWAFLPVNTCTDATHFFSSKHQEVIWKFRDHGNAVFYLKLDALSLLFVTCCIRYCH